MLAKLQIKGTGSNSSEDDGSNRQSNASSDSSPRRKESTSEPSSLGVPRKSTSEFLGNTDCKQELTPKRNATPSSTRGHSGGCGTESPDVRGDCEHYKRFGSSKTGNPLPKLGSHGNATETEVEDDVPRHGKSFASSDDSIGSHGSSSGRGDNESNSVVDCEILWKDLQMGEEIGQGKLI